MTSRAAKRHDSAEQRAGAGQEIGYQSLLEITDTAGLSRSLVPVSAMGTATALRNDPQAYAGLWLEFAAIRKVNQPISASTNANVPTATGGEFQFRLIVHARAMDRLACFGKRT